MTLTVTVERKNQLPDEYTITKEEAKVLEHHPHRSLVVAYARRSHLKIARALQEAAYWRISSKYGAGFACANTAFGAWEQLFAVVQTDFGSVECQLVMSASEAIDIQRAEACKPKPRTFPTRKSGVHKKKTLARKVAK
jgi:hypothetical protein